MKEAVMIILGLFVLVVLGNIWFHFVESILNRIKNLFSCGEDQNVWHELPPDDKEE